VLQFGYALTPEPESADVVIVNTCCFIERAERECQEVIEQMLELKSIGKLRHVVVMGCMPQRYGASLWQRFPGLDAIVGCGASNSLLGVLQALKKQEQPAQKYALREDPVRCEVPRFRISPRHYAYVRVAEGCDNRCAYCIVPHIRGPQRSKPLEFIHREVKQLVDDGAREIILIAQDTARYGTDLYRRRMLSRLIEQLARVKGLGWLRLMYCHPASLASGVIRELARIPKVVKYLDLPVQHANNTLLRRYGRRVTRRRLERLIGTLREMVPGIVLRTSVIVGLPGETSEMFEELLRFLRWARFERLGAFEYSPQRGTPAFDWPDQVPAPVKKNRLKRLTEVQQQIAFGFHRSLVGSELETIIDERLDGEHFQLLGRTYGDAPEIDGTVLLKGPTNLPPGSIVTVRITGYRGYDLEGEVLR
jgi:ribosomal protein S12 methylthiotransferase